MCNFVLGMLGVTVWGVWSSGVPWLDMAVMITIAAWLYAAALVLGWGMVIVVVITVPFGCWRNCGGWRG
jgi:hypothetical protein